MEHTILQKAFAPHIENFFAFIMEGTECCVTYELFLEYKNLVNASSTSIACAVQTIRTSTTQLIPDMDVL